MPTYTERAAGIYRATYQGCTEKAFTDQDTGEEQVRWLWRFQEVGDTTTMGTIDKITGTSLRSPNSNAYKMASGIVGRKLQPDDDTEAYIGQLYDVVYGENQAGNLTITGVVKVTQPAAGIAPEPVAESPVTNVESPVTNGPPAPLP